MNLGQLCVRVAAQLLGWIKTAMRAWLAGSATNLFTPIEVSPMDPEYKQRMADKGIDPWFPVCHRCYEVLVWYGGKYLCPCGEGHSDREADISKRELSK